MGYRVPRRGRRVSALRHGPRALAEVDRARTDHGVRCCRHRRAARAYGRPRGRRWWRRCCCAGARRRNWPTPMAGCSPTTHCNRRPRGGGAPSCSAARRAGRPRRDLFDRRRTRRAGPASPARDRQRPRRRATRDGAAQRGPGSPAARRCARPDAPAAPSSLADPARRAGRRRRTHDPAALQPPLPDLLDAYRGRDLVVKCAPGLDFDRLGWAGEVEVVSLDGGVREACLWSPGLAEGGVIRRATVLSSPTEPCGRSPTPIPTKSPNATPGEWIIDPDGAVVRAGLVRHYAARHGLWQLDPRIAYLTGDASPTACGGSAILEQAQVFARRRCGTNCAATIAGCAGDPGPWRRRRPGGPAAAAEAARNRSLSW